MAVEVMVEYCDACGYEMAFQEFKTQLAAAAPDVVIEGYTGRRSSFEVVVDGNSAFSKLAAHKFPDFEQLSAEIAEYTRSKAVPATWTKS